MSSTEERGLKNLINGTAWMTFAVLGYTVYNLIHYHNPAMTGVWPKVAPVALGAGILLGIYSVYASLVGIRTKFSEYHEPSLSNRKILAAGLLSLIMALAISQLALRQGFSPTMISLPIIIGWGMLETSVVQKFYEIGGFRIRQTSKTSHLIIGSAFIGILCCVSYSMVNVQLGYWLLMVPLLIMVIVMLMINNILMSL